MTLFPPFRHFAPGPRPKHVITPAAFICFNDVVGQRSYPLDWLGVGGVFGHGVPGCSSLVIT
ncbi:MAG: hypothetical protein BWX68_02050 [Verrucomicrobia bacterium ADurb.Bin063]|nr:MAG: hypothetical protein BWX68_02050 [Verrucomicrobia bacterium ADurb.Bin063]